MTCRVAVVQPKRVAASRYAHVLGDVVDAWRFERMTMFPDWLAVPHAAGLEHGEILAILFFRDHYEIMRLGDWVVHRHGQIEIVGDAEFSKTYKPIPREASHALESV